MTKRVAAVVGAMLVLGLGLGSCGGSSSDKPAFSASEANTVVDVTLQDYAFVGIPDSVRGPKVFFKASLKGGGPHELRIVAPGGQTVGAIPSFGGTAKKELAIVLPAGTYLAVCLLREGARTHADLGMSQTFTVSS